MKYTIAIVVFSLFFSSFAFAEDIEPILGCMDSKAINYNPLATEDNGSCKYPSGNAHPWSMGQVAWGGLNGFQISEIFVTLKRGQKFGNEYCPLWFPFDCWLFIKK